MGGDIFDVESDSVDGNTPRNSGILVSVGSRPQQQAHERRRASGGDSLESEANRDEPDDLFDDSARRSSDEARGEHQAVPTEVAQNVVRLSTRLMNLGAGLVVVGTMTLFCGPSVFMGAAVDYQALQQLLKDVDPEGFAEHDESIAGHSLERGGLIIISLLACLLAGSLSLFHGAVLLRRTLASHRRLELNDMLMRRYVTELPVFSIIASAILVILMVVASAFKVYELLNHDRSRVFFPGFVVAALASIVGAILSGMAKPAAAKLRNSLIEVIESEGGDGQTVMLRQIVVSGQDNESRSHDDLLHDAMGDDAAKARKRIKNLALFFVVLGVAEFLCGLVFNYLTFFAIQPLVLGCSLMILLPGIGLYRRMRLAEQGWEADVLVPTWAIICTLPRWAVFRGIFGVATIGWQSYVYFGHFLDETEATSSALNTYINIHWYFLTPILLFTTLTIAVGAHDILQRVPKLGDVARRNNVPVWFA